MLRRHYKTGELAALLSMSEDTLLRARDDGHLHPRRVGRHLFWDEGEVERWLASITVGRATRLTGENVAHLHDRRRAS